MSSLEKLIYDLLTKAKIPFQQEKIFKDCYNGFYRFDFYLPTKNVIIEINGAQHYELVKQFYKSRSEFTKAQERDRRKISYCLAHDIKLYIIPYWDIENIKSINDLFLDKYRARDKLHNDNTWSRQKVKVHN